MVNLNISARLEAISEIANRNNADFKLKDDEIIEWSKGDKPTEEEIQSIIDSKQYQRDRQYPVISEQLDLIYWDKKNGTKKWEETIDKIKKDFPKPE